MIKSYWGYQLVHKFDDNFWVYYDTGSTEFCLCEIIDVKETDGKLDYVDVNIVYRTTHQQKLNKEYLKVKYSE